MKRAVFGSKMIVNNVSVTPVFALVAYNNVCRARLAALNYYVLVYKNLFETKYGYTTATLALGSRL